MNMPWDNFVVYAGGSPPPALAVLPPVPLAPPPPVPQPLPWIYLDRTTGKTINLPGGTEIRCRESNYQGFVDRLLRFTNGTLQKSFEAPSAAAQWCCQVHTGRNGWMYLEYKQAGKWQRFEALR